MPLPPNGPIGDFISQLAAHDCLLEDMIESVIRDGKDAISSTAQLVVSDLEIADGSGYLRVFSGIDDGEVQSVEIHCHSPSLSCVLNEQEVLAIFTAFGEATPWSRPADEQTSLHGD